MSAGLTLRKHAVLNKEDGKSVIIAMDHGAIAGPLAGIEQPAQIVGACIAAQVDGILTTKGFVDASLEQWDRCTSLILRLTGGFTVLGGGFEEEMVVKAETAIAYGASCAAITVKFGHEHEGKFIREASLAIDACHALGLPVMVEAMVNGVYNGKKIPPNDPEGIRMAARMGAELSADMIKTTYTGSIESFAKVVQGCPVPIVILGGAKSDSIRDMFCAIHDSIVAGGKGIAIGRNIWAHENVALMLQAVKGLVHNNWSIDQACNKIGLT